MSTNDKWIEQILFLENSSPSLVTPVRLTVVAPSVVVLGDDGKLAVNHTPAIRIDDCGKRKCNQYHALSISPQVCVMGKCLTNSYDANYKPKYARHHKTINEENDCGVNHRYQQADADHDPEYDPWQHQVMVSLWKRKKSFIFRCD